MILTKELETTISHLNINYYRSLGYTNIKCNQRITIPVDHLPKDSNLKILVRCEICKCEKESIYQKYNKNISKYSLYTCVKCSSIKNKKTYFEKYGMENYVNTELQKKIRKDKYDKITQEIEIRGYINCIKCKIDTELSEFLVKNGRYKHVCRKCRNTNAYNSRNNKPHIKAWRNVLKGYLFRKQLKKEDRTLNLLKYTPDELRYHISNLFINDMSWENYGKKWHIDHIIHLSFFKDDTPCNVVNCLENLRPYNKEMNISRHNNLDDDCIKLISKYKTYIKEEYIK